MRSPAHIRVTSACATNSLTVKDICPAMKISQERLREPGLVVIDVTAAEEHADHEVSDGDRGAPTTKPGTTGVRSKAAPAVAGTHTYALLLANRPV